MLTSLYSALFRPTADRLSHDRVALVIGALVLIVLILNAAGAIGVGPWGVIGIGILFAFAGLVGWYWLSASVNLVAQWFGGQGTGQATAIAITQGLFPLILTAPAIAAGEWSVGFGALFSLAISIGVLILWVIAIREAHYLSWWKAIVTLVVTFALSGFALLGLLIWPLMLGLGM